MPPPDRAGAASPADSVMSVATTATAGTKRKVRDFEGEGGEETNINVVVRCRGRNEREVRENSAVVFSMDGVKGKTVQLAMGPSALSNKTYNFDKVFSPAADQLMIYDEVVTPILQEMLDGFNCTIFAYGQTGTGKTYTMSGDMKDTYGMLSDAAGIIPRVLHDLFNKLEESEAESSVKCSFIELYNEELRDLISVQENTKLKIYDDNTGKKGHSTTMVQGMEESHIKTAVQGIKLLQDGSHKRQVAATKCNDLSSRSHTVFTITAYIKRTSEDGEDYISAGKLNLVDLAGSENIQRSGAENKRAAEAGLINKSLLTLGRVINALVDKGSHIPYRESKLTRLLQDSLGGRTKTCIIATVSPAKSNLEETISTLDYAFRAKNIRNKPQINQMVNKKTLLKEFTMEIEKLKGELIATRQRNGVYLSNEGYEEMTVQSESRRILTEEQAAKIEMMEINLRNKVQELYSLTANFHTMKKENEATKAVLDETKSMLERTEVVLTDTRQRLEEEAVLRKAHQETEQQLSAVGGELISTLSKTVHDIGGLHSKNRRKSYLQGVNRNNWVVSQTQVAEITSLVESRVDEFQATQGEILDGVSSRMQTFVEQELDQLSSTQKFLEENVASFEQSEAEVSEQTASARNQMDNVLEEIKTLREDVKTRVGEGLQELSTAAERISAEVIIELGAFHTQLHGSYSGLGRDFKNLFEELMRHIETQKSEVNALRAQLKATHEAHVAAQIDAASKLENTLAEEKQQAAADRQNLLAQISLLINAQGEAQDIRLAQKIGAVQSEISASRNALDLASSNYDRGLQSWNEKEVALVENVLRARETLKSKLKEDWMVANKHNASIQTTTKAVNAETIRIVDEQMCDISSQMQALDYFVTRAKSQNGLHHDSHVQSLQNLSSTVKNSYSSIGQHFTLTFERVKDLGDDLSSKTASLQETLPPLTFGLKDPLSRLRSTVMNTGLHEYVPTGETPQKIQYEFPTVLPRTNAHETLLAAMRNPESSMPAASTTPAIFSDAPESMIRSSSSSDASDKLSGGLREVSVNVRDAAPSVDVTTDTDSSADAPVPLLKKSLSSLRLPQKVVKKAGVLPLEGRENAIPVFSQSTGRRRSPRHGAL